MYPFWNQFQSIAKFQYLIYAVVPKSCKPWLIKIYLPSAKNYPKISTVRSLDLGKMIYWSKFTKKIVELLQLVFTNLEINNKSKIIVLQDKVESQLQSLELPCFTLVFGSQLKIFQPKQFLKLTQIVFLDANVKNKNKIFNCDDMFVQEKSK